ncbi:hypothetical protein Ddc_05787 [Ditylenchus destructor]|nr:hypothetical protein Ddc_05787 [Ditylenchus destructor]
MQSQKTVQERLVQKCVDRFGVQSLGIGECYELLSSILQLEMSGIRPCSLPHTPPHTMHSSDFHSECGNVERQISSYAIPILQVLCLFGNVLNLLVYRLPYFHGSSAVYFLRAKAIANLIFVESRVLEVIHAWMPTADANVEFLYWRSRPLIISIANISGTLSTWVTLFITIETAMCVISPFRFRQYCTRRTTMVLLICTFLASASLHLIFFSTHRVLPKLSLQTYFPTSPIAPHVPHYFRHHQTRQNASDSSEQDNQACWFLGLSYSMQPIAALLTNQSYEKIYYWLQMLCSIVVPTLAMLVCSLLIITRFTIKAFSQRRKCVIRMTCATTLCHLLFEGPALVTFGAVALKGASSHHHDSNICIINHANNLLSVFNATIPFFVFVGCNQQFRKMSLFYLSPFRFITQTGSERRKRKFSAMDESNRSVCPPVSLANGHPLLTPAESRRSQLRPPSKKSSFLELSNI